MGWDSTRRIESRGTDFSRFIQEQLLCNMFNRRVFYTIQTIAKIIKKKSAQIGTNTIILGVLYIIVKEMFLLSKEAA